MCDAHTDYKPPCHSNAPCTLLPVHRHIPEPGNMPRLGWAGLDNDGPGYRILAPLQSVYLTTTTAPHTTHTQLIYTTQQHSQQQKIYNKA